MTLLCALAIGGAMFRIPFMGPARNSVAQNLGEHRIEGSIVDVDRGESTAAIVVADVEVDDVAKDDRVRVTVPLFPMPSLGDRVSIVCALERPESFEGFAYDRYLALRDVYAVCRTSEIPLVLAADADQRLALDLARLRQAMIGRIEATLADPQASLLAGLLFGEAQFSDEWRDRFLATGTSHVVAASGFNVSIVVLVLFSTLTWLGIRRQWAFPVLIAGIAAYVVLAGAEPAVVRAGVMGGLVLLARHIGRKTTMRNIVLLAVAVMVTVEPRLVLDDVGFQLSVASTVALIWIAPKLAERFAWVPKGWGIREALVSSLAATFFTLPIVVLQFGDVSLVGPLVNMLVLPFIPVAMGLGALVLLGITWLAMPAWTLLTLLLEAIRAIAAVPGTVVSIPDAVRAVIAAVLALIIAYVCKRFAFFSRS